MAHTVGIGDEFSRRTGNRCILGWLGACVAMVSGQRRPSHDFVILLLMLLIVTSHVNCRSLPNTAQPTEEQTVSCDLQYWAAYSFLTISISLPISKRHSKTFGLSSSISTRTMRISFQNIVPEVRYVIANDRKMALNNASVSM